MTKDTDKFKQMLADELQTLVEELKNIGRINPDNPADWEALPDKLDTQPGDENELADTIESYEENTAILKQLEARYNEVKSALNRIKDGTYGTCEVGGEEIEEERLEANPAARTCIKHLE